MASGSKAIVILTVFVFILSLFSLGIFYLSAKTLFYSISGYATSTGQANLSIETVAAINFTTNKINWGSGRVNTGASYAVLTSEATNNVTDGNWTLQTPGGLRIENIGNVNVSLNLSGSKTPDQMIGGTNSNYSWKFTTNIEGEGCSLSVGILAGEWLSVPTTTTSICTNFASLDTGDLIRVDFMLVVPSDSKAGLLGDVITATAFPN